MQISDESFGPWFKKYPDLEVIKPIKSGKEATVFLVKIKNKLLALKIYRENHFKSTNADYIQGKYFKERSVRRAVAKRNKYGKKIIQRIWARREFYMLEQFYNLGANVPKVLDFTDDAILMEYFGDENNAAPKLLGVKLTKEQAVLVYRDIVASMKAFLQAGIIHGDLSEHNILWWNDKAYIIDFPQAIDIRRNPNARTMLFRDVYNVNKFFGKFVEVEESLFDELVGNLTV